MKSMYPLFYKIPKISLKLADIRAFGAGLVMISVIFALVNPGVVNTAAEEMTAMFDTPALPTIGLKDPIRTLSVFATAYSSDPWQTDSTPCHPAMGSYDLCENFKKYGETDTIAANFLPLGTRVRFPKLYGSKVFTVRDRMNSRYNYANIGYYRIDFYVAKMDKTGEIDADASRDAARKFGARQNIIMEVF